MNGRTRSNPGRHRLGHPTADVHSAAEDQNRTTTNTGGEQRGLNLVSKHHAPNGGMTLRTPPSCRSCESRLSPRRQLPPPGNETNGNTHGDASRKGNDIHGCHRRRSDQSRTRFSSVALHISTPPRSWPALTVASHRRRCSNMPSKPHQREPLQPHCRGRTPQAPACGTNEEPQHPPSGARTRTTTTAFARTRGLPPDPV
mgnify:CR=1 FL=1